MMMSRTLLAVILKMRCFLASSGSSSSASTVSSISFRNRSENAEVLLGFFPKVSFIWASSSLISGSSPPKSAALGSSSSDMFISSP